MFLFSDVDKELTKAIEKFPDWPSNMFAAIAVVNEEIGEINKAILQFHFEGSKGVTESDIREEAIQSIAMLIRFITSLDNGNYFTDTTQHLQDKW